MTRNPIIIALDMASADEARTLVRRLGSRAGFYKVGMEMYAAAGMEFVRWLIAEGKDVFLDLKLYDISETVKRATAVIARTGVRFLTVHSSSAVVRAAVEGKGDANISVLAVTVLTSYDRKDLEDLGYSCDVSDQVHFLACKSVEAGADGLVASPLEAAKLRFIAGPDRIIVTPGVRSPGASKGDQKRVATPAEAIRSGADYLVIGRQVTRAADPAGEVTRILAEIAAG